MYTKIFICLLLACTLAKADLLSPACGALFGLLPTQLSDPLLVPGGCAINSCGTADGSGYFDITCKLLCQVAGYSIGACTHPSDPPSGGQCICSGENLLAPLNLPLLVPLYCELFGGCACGSCGYEGKTNCTVVPNGAVLTCQH